MFLILFFIFILFFYKPIFIDTNVLYSNTILLNKHNKEIPKTWNQLIETAVYIRDQEKELFNNTSFDPFLGIFSGIVLI